MIRSKRPWLAACLVLLACGPKQPKPLASRQEVTPSGVTSTLVTSNLLRSDYVGSERCGECHQAIHARWSTSPMHRMTRIADEAEIRAPFDGSEFVFMNDRAVMSTNEGHRFVALHSADKKTSLFRVTKVIGGRYREDFAGEPVIARTATAPAQGAERILPISFMYDRSEWRYKGYSVLVTERPGLRPGPQWDRTCIFCHNTPPGISRLYDELLGPGAPSYQGATHGNLLPEDRRWHYRIRDASALRMVLADELSTMEAPQPDEQTPTQRWLTHTLLSTRKFFREDHLVEVGIGCEACHGGSEAHARDPSVQPSYAMTSPLLRIDPADGQRPPSRAAHINRSCAQCHAVLFSRYPHTWEGGERRQDPGGSNANSGEARDFLLGGCAQELACTSCHDPHAEDDREALRRLASPEGNTVCLECHSELADDGVLRAHSHHDPNGAGAACVGCHMARKNLGLGYDLTRYHRIGSPTDPERVERDRPLECALCHGERSVATLVADMERWWGHRYDRDALHALYGTNLDVDPLLSTLDRGQPHEQVVAIARLGEMGRQDALDVLVQKLGHAYPLLRYYTRESLERISDHDLPLDMSRPGSELAREGRAWLQTVLSAQSP